MPFVPAVLDCATKVAGLSTSVIVSVPPVVRAALVSLRATVADDKTAASFVPLIVTITEVIGRSEQGMTRPFLCAVNFCETYYVKGAYAGMNSLCCEWVANRLAELVLPDAPLGLPMFAMAEVPEVLVDGSARPDIADLGAGKVFASMEIRDGQELNRSASEGWPEETMALLLLLDLWLRNEDRTLSVHGGNPNLLVEPIPLLLDDDLEGALWKDESRREMLWAYDFNLAFDEDFNRERFFGAHVFGAMLKQWPEGFREKMEPRMRYALEQVRAIFSELPLEWLHLDGDDSLPVQLDVERVISVLSLPFTNPELFWKLP